MAEKALKQPEVFIWTGTDKRGVRVKGQTRGSNPTLIKADLRKQGIKPLKVKKQSALFKKTAKKRIIPKDIAVFFRRGGAGGKFDPLDRRPGRVDHPPRGPCDFGANPVSGDQADGVRRHWKASFP